MFSNNSLNSKVICWSALTYFSIKSILYGGRIEVIQIVLVLLYVQTNFFSRWSMKKLYLSLLLAFMVFFIIGRLRINPSLMLEVFSAPSALFSFPTVSGTDVVHSNFGDVQHASARMVGLVDTSFWDVEFRFKSWISYVFNIFLTGTQFKELSNLALIDQKVYGAGGGGFISAQFYVWLGWLGPIVSGSFLGWVFSNGLKINAKRSFSIYAFALLITFPRWYAYSPMSLVKICIITALFYILFVSIFRLITNIKKPYN